MFFFFLIWCLFVCLCLSVCLYHCMCDRLLVCMYGVCMQSLLCYFGSLPEVCLNLPWFQMTPRLQKRALRSVTQLIFCHL